MLLSCCGARQMLCLTKQEQHLADRCHSLPSLSPPLAAVGSLPFAMTMSLRTSVMGRNVPFFAKNH